MTTNMTTTAGMTKPDLIAFGELGIAAGMAGKPIAICFSESAATVDCEHWKYFVRFTDLERVLHVHSQADVTRLKKFFNSWRLVVVHALRLFNTVAWIFVIIQLDRPRSTFSRANSMSGKSRRI